MPKCQICNKTTENVMFNYRQECRSCRKARKQLQKDGASLRGIKNYLKATGLQLELAAPAVLAEVSNENVVEFRSKPSKAEH